ncbi:PhoPQ-activated pathogenicity-related family protein [Aureliella helgolandensis]|uniref:PhoPQ-activated pathogenicity-related protein n=1 Tax=Aureliella helgolandensis TaxID=2527968 RepID=A0A518G668_9BACT|nr:PhoPQ-activated protein PqaA family protein [Aureliella helgolandensis]QDV24064.1 PhoPQ-activated pathogenicity-related protein [Aureliella helgolandensis]
MLGRRILGLFIASCCLCNSIPQGRAQGVGDTAVASAPTPRIKATTQPLYDYVSAPDASYDWEVRERLTIQDCDVLRVHLVSQTWHDIAWRHVVYLIKPPNLDPQRRDAVLVVAGGSWDQAWPENGPQSVSLRGEAQLMAGVAQQFGCIIAVASQIPFQPMMEGKHEDEIIATTFKNYIESGDATWPLLLPMVKAAMRSMDAATAAAQREWQVNLENFTVTGASKRGWTTWLTGAMDSRVTAIAPMVIDMLRMDRQMQHQIDSWGKYSEQIADYTELQLPKMLGTPEGQSLQGIVDPFAYRGQLGQPKLLIFGTNDRYWPLDACNLYWDQLEGDKYLLYVPNQGHGIRDYARLIGSLSALHHSLHGGPALPKLTWDHQQADNQSELVVATKDSIDSVHGWVASSDSKDFRDATWSQQACQRIDEESWKLTVAAPEKGYRAFFAEAVFLSNDLPGFLSTNMTIVGGNP